MEMLNLMTTRIHGQFKQSFARLIYGLVVTFLVLFVSISLCGCASDSSVSSNSSPSKENTLSEVKIGTMPTEDMLPGWVAEKNGYFNECGVEVTIESFDSAQSLTAAIASGQVDMAMTDIMRTVRLCETGTPVISEWVTLGAVASEGRFGVLAFADAPYDDMQGLVEYLKQNPDAPGVGVAANTVPEYVLDSLAAPYLDEGEFIRTEEVASLPDRYGLVASGNLNGAALPNSLLELGSASGLKIVGDDTSGNNISMSVMVAREQFAKENAEIINSVAKAWDMAVDDINAIVANSNDDANQDTQTSESQKMADLTDLLIEHANINSSIAESYSISIYPHASSDGELVHPDGTDVDAQLAWMRTKDYGAKNIVYSPESGAFLEDQQ